MAIHLAAWLPLALILWDGANNTLTANPIQAITQRTGKTALAVRILASGSGPEPELLRGRMVEFQDSLRDQAHAKGEALRSRRS